MDSLIMFMVASAVTGNFLSGFVILLAYWFVRTSNAV